MFYDKFVELCAKKGVAPTRAALDAGISKSLVSKWKSNEAKDPSPEVARKLANYFGITIAELFGENSEQKEKAPAETGERAIDDDDIKLALFGGDGEVTDAMWDEALFAIQLIKERHKREKEKNG